MARIIINTVDSFGEKTVQKIIAKKRTEENKVIYSYKNKIEVGEITISSSETKILRAGEAESELKLIPDITTNFIYSTPYFKKVFSIFCKEYLYTENRLAASYEIYDADSFVNKLEIEIIEII